MGDPLLDSFRADFQEIMAMTGQLEASLAEAIGEETDPEARDGLGQLLDLFRTAKSDCERELPPAVADMVGQIRQGEKEMAALQVRADELARRGEEIVANGRQALEQARARAAAEARAPKPPTPADLARKRLAALAKSQGADGPPPELKEGSVLQKHLMDLLQPKTETRGSRAIALGNIWENWNPDPEDPAPPADDQ